MLFQFPFFQHLLDRNISVAAAATASICIVGLSILRNGLKGYLESNASLLLLFVPFILGSSIYNSTFTADTLMILMIIVIAPALSTFDEWIRPAYAVALMGLSVHAIATIIFFIWPSSYLVVESATTLSTYPGAWDYRSGLSGHYSFNGMYNALGLLLASPRMLAGTSRKARALGTMLFCTFLIALLLTTKRAPLLFVLVTLVILFVLFMRRAPGRSPVLRARGLAVALTGGIVMMLFNPDVASVLDRIFAESTGFSDYSSGRTVLWEHAISEWGGAPLFGTGWGTYWIEWFDGTSVVVSVGAHNVILQLLAETGIIGASLFVIFYVSALAATVRLYKLNRKAATTSVAKEHSTRVLFGAAAVQIFFGLYSLVGNPLFDSPTFVVYALSIAAALSSARTTSPARDTSDSSQHQIYS